MSASRANRKADAANSHDIYANMSCLQSSLRKEPEVSRSPSCLLCHALTLRQLQRHPRGTLRSLWQVRPSAVRRLPRALAHLGLYGRFKLLTLRSQIRQGIANNTKGTAFVVYEDVMDAKSACDKLNGFNFQNRYLVGT